MRTAVNSWVSDELLLLRERHKITNREIAEDIGISPEWVGKCLSGEKGSEHCRVLIENSIRRLADARWRNVDR